MNIQKPCFSSQDLENIIIPIHNDGSTELKQLAERIEKTRLGEKWNLQPLGMFSAIVDRAVNPDCSSAPFPIEEIQKMIRELLIDVPGRYSSHTHEVMKSVSEQAKEAQKAAMLSSMKQRAKSAPEPLLREMIDHTLPLRNALDHRQITSIISLCLENMPPKEVIRVLLDSAAQWKISEDRDLPIQVLLLLAEKKESYVSEHVHRFAFNADDPRDKKALIEIGTAAAHANVPNFSKNIKNYGFDKKTRLSIAKEAIRWIDSPSSYIHYYGFDVKEEDDRKFLVDIAQREARWNKNLSKNIQNYGFNPKDDDDKEELFTIAMKAMENDSDHVPESIQNYGFDPDIPRDKQMLIELARVGARHGKNLSKHIRNFGLDPINDKQELFKIAIIAAQCRWFSGDSVSEYLKNYDFNPEITEDNEKLFEIAKLTAQNGNKTSKYIQNYGLTKKQRFEIAKIASARGNAFSEHIKNYGFDPNIPEEKEWLIELAMLMAKKGLITQHIENFGLDLQHPNEKKALRKIARLNAQGGGRLCKPIQYFGFDPKNLKDKEKILEIAKLATQTPDGIQNCKDYGLDPTDPLDKANLVEVAKQSYLKFPYRLDRNINNCGLDLSNPKDKEALVDILTIFFTDHPEEVKTLNTYELDRKTKLSIFKHAAQHNGKGVSLHVPSFGLDPKNAEDRKEIIEIAMLAAQHDGWATSRNIKNYGLNGENSEDKQALITILKVAVKQGKGLALLYVKKYGLNPECCEDKKLLVELSILAAGGYGKQAFEYARECGLDHKRDKEYFMDLAKNTLLRGLPYHFLFSSYSGFSREDLHELFVFSLMHKPIDVTSPSTIEHSRPFIQEGFYCYSKGPLGSLSSLVESFVSFYSWNRSWDQSKKKFLAVLAPFELGESLNTLIREIETFPTQAQKDNALLWLASSILFLKTAEQETGVPLAAFDLKRLLPILTVNDAKLRYQMTLAIPLTFSLKEKKHKQQVLTTVKLAALRNGEAAFLYAQECGLDPKGEDRKYFMAIARKTLDQGLPSLYLLEESRFSWEELFELFVFSLMRNPIEVETPKSVEGHTSFLKQLAARYEPKEPFGSLALFLKGSLHSKDWNVIKQKFLAVLAPFRLGQPLNLLLREIEKSSSHTQKCNTLLWLAVSILFINTNERTTGVALAAFDLKRFMPLLAIKQTKLLYEKSRALTKIKKE